MRYIYKVINLIKLFIMKKLKLCLLLALGLTVIYSCSKDDLTTIEEETKIEETALRAGNLPAASGQGTIDWVAEGKRHFSFHAKTKKDGSVSGSGVLTYTQGDLKIRFDIDCIQVEGSTAYITGTITSHSESPELVGRVCYFSATDNGEGNNANPDVMRPLNIGGELSNWDCSIRTVSGYLEVLEGNIQVSGGN